jgi:hypothetical protein
MLEHSMRKSILAAAAIAGTAIALMFCNGCASSERADDRFGLTERFIPPRQPVFITGPAALLLTNVEVFSCHVLAQGASGSQQAGELFGRSGKLLFALEADPAAGKRFRTGGFSFLWDTREAKGFLLSDALQGVAPLASNATFTNVLSRTAADTAPQQIQGYHCEAENAVVTGSDGPTSLFQVWRARDLRNFPVRITSEEGQAPMTISFSKVRFEAPPNEEFLAPEPFTKYANPESLVNEFVMRQQQLRGGGRPITTDYGSAPKVQPR